MNASMIIEWATRNNFFAVNDKSFRSYRPGEDLSMEIKKMSVVFITERTGHLPKITSKLFKDLSYDQIAGEIRGLDAFAISA